ncbi:DnaE-like DNA polymerase III alpha [Gordonia phage ParvusTarda]|uniref:DnaE-like DNA polymerase III alpha n=1 Tax=Gordonia phage ParvusTarda TaxID=2927261 RepID=A0A9E7QPS8_9CAUD|nr:DnaE-like DNA polymerase III alpha [Gordonia phage ParvusTarda]
MRWVSLHTHSTFSYGDGYGPVKDHVARVEELGMTAICLTEHGHNSSHVQLEKACKGTGIKPMYGCELYVVHDNWEEQRRKYHQIAIAINEKGYQNLNRIVSIANSPEYQYDRFPTIPKHILFEYSDGLVVTSGCADSLLSCTLLGGKNMGPKRLEYNEEQYRETVALAAEYQEVFGPRYFLEVQRFPRLDRTRVLNPAFERIGAELGIELVATADVHYPHPGDNKMQRILHAANRGGGKTIAQADAEWEYDILLTYPESDSEIYHDLIATGLSPKAAKRSILNTAAIAKRCTVELPKNEPIKWPYPGSGLRGEDIVADVEKEGNNDPQTYSSIEEYTWARLRKGWAFRIQSNVHMRKNKAQYTERVKYEMERIIPRGFCDYFGMLSYLVTWAKDNKIPVGPARGSAAASLVCYLLRITEVDPLQFPTMMFERFIDPKRLDLPDVDLDFADDRRDEVRQEAIRVFGSDRVGNIGNFTRYKGKNSITDVAKVYGIPKFDTQVVKDLIIERSGGDSRQNDTLMDTFEMFPKARAVLDKHPELELASKLEGNYRGAGVHAAGLVISNASIPDTCALHTQESGGREITAVPYDKKDAEYLGMLKADFLGLKTMGEIGIMLNIIGMDLEDLYRIPLDDEEVMDAFQRNDVQGIFQFEGRATRVTCDRVKPDNFMELADINALSRPGPLFSGMTDHYIKVKWGDMEIEKLHPIVDEYTSFTKGQIVYQEQVLGIIKDLGGFPVQRVGDIRKIISQKLGEASFNEMYEEFESGAKRLHNVEPALAKRIWSFMVTSATYSFNIAHCVSYSMLAFWQMWLKIHDPVAFYYAKLEKTPNDKNNQDKIRKYMKDAVRHGVSVAAPHLNKSTKSWAYDHYVPASKTKPITWKEGDPLVGAVHAGFTQIKGIGDSYADNILELRDRLGGFDSWEDLLGAKGIGPGRLEKIMAFVEKDDPFDVRLAEHILTEYRRRINLGIDGWDEVLEPDMTSDEVPKDFFGMFTWMGMVKKKEFKDLMEDERARSGQSTEEIMARLKDPHLTKSCTLHCYDDGDEEIYARISRWDYEALETLLEEIEPNKDVIVITGKRKRMFGISVGVKNIQVIDPTDDIPGILENARKKAAGIQ